MPDVPPLDRPFRMGPWTVEPQLSRLRSDEDGRSVHLEPKAMDLLVLLAARGGRVVSKAEILEEVWEGRAVSDDALTGTVAQLRRALGDDARRPSCIETIPKRGYRLLLPVREKPAPAGAAPPARSHRRRALRLATAGLLVLAAVLGGAWLFVEAGGVAGEAESRQAAEAYRRGRAALAQRNAAALRQAEIYFQQAVALDPRHAAARAGLADTYCSMVDAGLDSPARLFPLARRAAEEALALDPGLAEAHTSLAAVLFIHDRDFSAAEGRLRRALELDPGSRPAHRLYAFLLSALGRHQEAIAEARRALAVDPLNLPAHRDLAEILLLARRYDDVIDQMRETLTLDPDLPDAYIKTGFAYLFLGREGDAFAAFRAGYERLGVSAELLTQVDEAFAREGLRGVFRCVAELMESPAHLGLIGSLTDRAIVYGLMGDRDRALDALERADARRDPNLLWLPVAPYADPLRSEPRYARLVAGLGLPAPPPVPAARQAP